MSRLVVWTALLVMSVGLVGCPIFPDQTGCTADRDCAAGYVCDLSTNQCSMNALNDHVCSQPYQCGTNETCGSDGVCHSGDCTFWGCPAGYACGVQSGSWACDQGLIVATGGVSGIGGATSGGAVNYGGMSAGGASEGNGGASMAGGSGNAGGALNVGGSSNGGGSAGASSGGVGGASAGASNGGSGG